MKLRLDSLQTAATREAGPLLLPIPQYALQKSLGSLLLPKQDMVLPSFVLPPCRMVLPVQAS